MVKFGKVALLYGGTSAEREVSLASGQAVYEALCARGVQVELVDSQDHRRVLNLREEGFNGAFIALHGRGGEDGQIQAILEWQELPYTGAGVLACALAMDKVLTKKIWASSGLPVQRDWVLDASTSYEFLVAELGAKRFAVKPALEGSSVGISAVASEEQLREAYEKAGGAREKIMAEPWIKGRELTCAIIGERVLPTVEIATGAGHQFYDYAAKYTDDSTKYLCPAPIDPTLDRRLAEITQQAFTSIGARGWGRCDFILDGDQKPWLLEINLAPGMTSHSLVPMAAREVGLSFADLVLLLLEDGYKSQRAA